MSSRMNIYINKNDHNYNNNSFNQQVLYPPRIRIAGILANGGTKKALTPEYMNGTWVP